MATAPEIDSAMLEALHEAAKGANVLSFAEYMRVALYHPTLGYYRRSQPRVGRDPERDFYTSSNLEPEFSQLLKAAFASLLQKEDLHEFTLVEIGCEPGQALFTDNHAPFGATTALPLGAELTIPDKAVVFANELLDAQPFHRLVFSNGAWRECGVALECKALREVLLPEFTPAVAKHRSRLPQSAQEGYRIDWPLEAEQLLRALTRQEWSGLLVTLDYGLPRETVFQERPEGTARAYSRHRQHGKLFTHPGTTDLTCHLIWDDLVAVLRDAGFDRVERESQEAFFMHHAEAAIAAALNSGSDLSRRGRIMELLHPAHLGAKFECLWAQRKSTGKPVKS